MLRTFPCALLFLSVLAASTPCQGFYTYDNSSPGFTRLGYLDSAAYPGGAPAPLAPFFLPNAALLGPTALPLGGMAADDVSGLVYTTDGLFIAADYNPLFVPYLTGPVPGAPPVPLPITPIFGPVTGLSVDHVNNVLWMSDAVSFAPFTLGPPYAMLAAPIPVPLLSGVPVTGIGFEPSSATLWAVDASGAVLHFTTLGAPIGPQPVVIVPPSTASPGMCGLAINTANGAGAFPNPACSPQLSSQHVVVTDGIFVYDALPGIAAPLPVAPSTGLGAMGLAYSSVYQTLLGFGICPVLPNPPLVGTLAPNAVGPLVTPVVQGLCLLNGPPNQIVTLHADLCPIPGGAFIPFSLETLWINPFSNSYVSAGAITDAFGRAVIPLSFVPVPAGVQFSFQWTFPSPNSPLTVCLTEAATVTTGLP